MERIRGIQWLAVGFMFVGLVARWIHVDEHGILLNVGFIIFGIISLIEGVRRKHYKQFNIGTLKIILPVIVIIVATDNLLSWHSQYGILGLVVLSQYYLGQRNAVLNGKTK